MWRQNAVDVAGSEDFTSRITLRWCVSSAMSLSPDGFPGLFGGVEEADEGVGDELSGEVDTSPGSVEDVGVVVGGG